MRGIFLVAALCACASAARADGAADAIQAAIQAQDYDKAISLSNQALADPKLTNDEILAIRGERGIAYIVTGKSKDGIDDLTYALDSLGGAKDQDKKDFAPIYLLRGIGYRAIGNFDAAFADYKSSIAADPSAPDGYEASGDAYYAQGKTDDAIASYSDAISRDPKDVEALVNRGENYENKGAMDKAVADYNAAIGIKPDYAMAYNDRGTVYDHGGKLAAAKADYDKAVSLDAAEPLYLRNRADIHNRLAEWQLAIDDLNKALTLDNDDKAKAAIAGMMKTAQDGLAKKTP
jgi:tetratricopeptide (TPR) repeat protein